MLIEDKSVLLAAASILTVEARHSSTLNLLGGTSRRISTTRPGCKAHSLMTSSGCAAPGFRRLDDPFCV